MPVPDVDGVRSDPHEGVTAGECLGLPPVRGGQPAVQQSEFGEDEGAGADGRDAGGPLGEDAGRGQQALLGGLLGQVITPATTTVSTGPASAAVTVPVRASPLAAVTVPPWGDQHEFVGVAELARLVQDLGGAAHVEHGDAVEDDEGDAVGRHVERLAWGRVRICEWLRGRTRGWTRGWRHVRICGFPGSEDMAPAYADDESGGTGQRAGRRRAAGTASGRAAPRRGKNDE